MTKILITGSRSWSDVEYLEGVFRTWDELIKGPKTLISGACPQGADMMGEKIAHELGWQVDLYPADWSKHGRRAGFVRNEEMVNLQPEYTLAFVRDNSNGASMTVRLAKTANIPVEVHSSQSPSPKVSQKRFGFEGNPLFDSKRGWDEHPNLW